MKSITAAALLLTAATALAQPAPPTDQQIVQAHAACHKPENIIYTGGGKGGPPDVTRVKTDFRAEMKAQCDAIDAEYNKRDIAARATAIDQAQRDQLNEIAKQLKKNEN